MMDTLVIKYKENANDKEWLDQVVLYCAPRGIMLEVNGGRIGFQGLHEDMKDLRNYIENLDQSRAK